MDNQIIQGVDNTNKAIEVKFYGKSNSSES